VANIEFLGLEEIYVSLGNWMSSDMGTKQKDMLWWLKSEYLCIDMRVMRLLQI
jgi:hypothetical protein